MWRFDPYTDTGGQPRWRLYDGVGFMAAHSGESFNSAWNRDRAMREFKAGAASWHWQVLASRDGGWYWHATSYGNSRIVGWSGRMWTDRTVADQSMRVVQSNAGSASCP